MKLLFSICTAIAFFFVLDLFASSEEDPGKGFDWAVVDDRVMGGRSYSELKEYGEFWRWEGQLSYENRGGFSSIRTNWDLGFLNDADSLILHVRGSERLFKFRLESSQRYYDPVHEVSFTPNQTWQTLILPLELFDVSILGKPAQDVASDLNPERMGRMGMMCNSGEPGEFWLEFRQIEIR